MHCPKCGHEVEGAFCAACGIPMVSTNIETTPHEITETNHAQSKLWPVALVIVVLLAGIGYWAWDMSQSMQEDAENQDMLLSIAYDRYRAIETAGSGDSVELRDLMATMDPSLAIAYDENGHVTEFDEDRLLMRATNGEEAINTNGTGAVAAFVMSDYDQLISSIQDGQWGSPEIDAMISRLELAHYLGLAQLDDLPVLAAYVRAEESYREDSEFSDSRLSRALQSIPDDYDGVLASQVLSRKQELAASSPLYQSHEEIAYYTEEIERLDREIAEFSQIELLDLDWSISGQYAQVDGKVKNNLSFPISYVEVEVVYTSDPDGKNMVDSDWTFAVGSHPLQPGYVTSFSLMTPYTEGMEYANVRVVAFSK